LVASWIERTPLRDVLKYIETYIRKKYQEGASSLESSPRRASTSKFWVRYANKERNVAVEIGISSASQRYSTFHSTFLIIMFTNTFNTSSLESLALPMKADR
jgi:hypothetical protein